LELLVRVHSFFSLPDGGPKSWLQGRTLPSQVVDMHNYGLMWLVDFVAEHYMWGSKQYISLWRDLETDSIEIKSDEHLMEWFELNLENGVVCIVAQVNDFEGPLQFSPTKRRCHPSVRDRVATSETATNLEPQVRQPQTLEPEVRQPQILKPNSYLKKGGPHRVHCSFHQQNVGATLM
jgi:hypothetical protein